MISLNIAQISETEPERAARLKREQREAADRPRIAELVHEWMVSAFPVYARAEARKRAARDFVESIQLDNNLPKVTVLDTLRPGWRGWRPISVTAQEREDKAAREEAERINPVIAPTPEPEF